MLYGNAGCFTGRGVDYGEGNKTQYLVIFPAGINCSSFYIPIINDTCSEDDEEFSITIMKQSLPFGVELDNDNKVADVLIVDNDSE